jgi:thioredoxin-related protein
MHRFISAGSRTAHLPGSKGAPALRRVVPLILVLMVLSGFAAAAPAAEGFNPSPHAIDIPQWFKTSFLDFREDIAEAKKEGRRLMVYFGQDGCPYCRELMRVNFSQKEIADSARRHFDAIAINIWGDREVVWLDRKVYTEKTFSALMKIQFTPTLLFFDEQGKIVLRLNGYYPPHRFAAALEYVAGRHESRISFADYLAQSVREEASGRLHDQPYFMRPPFNLARTARSAKPLAVLFEQKECAACDELHRTGLTRSAVRSLVGKFDVVRLELFGRARVVTPDARELTEERWARELRIAYTPTLVFFDVKGREVFRVEGYVRPFHLESGFDYVASGAYRRQPSFQRYLQSRAERIRKTGGEVELW